MTKDEFMQALDDEMRGRASDLDRIMPVIVAFVAAWLEESDLYADAEGPQGDKAARLWREAMA